MSDLTYPKLCALLAEKPSRLSQAMHNAGFKALGEPFTYVNFATTDTAFAVSAMKQLGVRGYSLTIPHKEVGLKMVDRLSEDAQEIQAINTIVNDGKLLTGFNTDWIGIREALNEAEVKVGAGKIMLLGAGGAARAAIYALKKMGAKDVTVVGRTPERSRKLVDEFGVDCESFDQFSKELQGVQLLINATPMSKAKDYPFELAKIPRSLAIFDMVTSNTDLLSESSKNGSKCIAGARMLLFQALEQFKLFTGKEAPRNAMEAALTKELGGS